jgi:hypothetical protein
MSILLPDTELYIEEEKEAASAVGIPDRRYYRPITEVKPGDILDFLIQEHNAYRAGLHRDVRFGDQKGLFSWATRKQWPTPGQRIALFEQPTHSHKYLGFEGEIPRGQYGGGTVKKLEQGKILVTDVTPDSIHFTVAHKRYPERFVMVKPKGWMKDKAWLLINKTPAVGLPYDKVRYKKIPAPEVEKYIQQMKDGDTFEAKIDGASSLIKLLRHGVELVSYRTSKETGRPIVHTEKVLQDLGHKLNIPPELVGTVLKGELYGMRNSKVIPPQELGGLLNSSIAKSLEDQRSRGIRLKNMVYDVQQLGNRHVDWHKVTRPDRRNMLQNVLKHLPEDIFHISPAATTPQEAKTLWDNIQSGEHPLTHEGAIMWPLRGTPMKGKLVEDNDVHITGTFPGEGKYKDTGIGGFTYALQPGGPTIGRVGTGLSDALRQEVFLNPEAYTGRIARIRSQEQLPSGAYRAPSLIAFHEDYPGTKLSSVLVNTQFATVDVLDSLGITGSKEDIIDG